MTAKIWLRRNESMRPETMTALSPQIYEYPTVHIRSGSRMVQRTPAAPESSSRDSPGVERTPSKAQRFQIWVMRASAPSTAEDTRPKEQEFTRLPSVPFGRLSDGQPGKYTESSIVESRAPLRRLS